MTTQEKDALVTEALTSVTKVVKRLNVVWPGQSPEPRMYCSLCAVAVMSLLKKRGVDALFQAGSAGWRMVPPELDDGVSPTWFWHKWEADAGFARAFTRQFPEAHCWAVIPGDEPEFIDITTAVLPQKVKAHGFTWKEKQPPSYLWQTRAEYLKDETVQFTPDPQAMLVCMAFARAVLRAAAASL